MIFDAQINKLDPEVFAVFLSHGRKTLKRCGDLLHGLSRQVQDHDLRVKDIRKMLIILHALKGDSLCLGMTELSFRIHRLEACLGEAAVSEQDAVWLGLWQDLIVSFEAYEKLGHAHPQDMAMDVLEKPALEFFQGLNSVRHAATLLRGLEKNVQILVHDEGPPHVVGSLYQKVFEDIVSHLIRNALAHGIEDVPTRIKLGKNPRGKIDVLIVDDGIRFEDDGRGLDFEKIRAKAISSGLMSSGADIDRNQLAHLVFEAGLSTEDEATLLSGRGMGLYAIRQSLDDLCGNVHLQLKDEEKGSGQFFILVTIPQSLRRL